MEHIIQFGINIDDEAIKNAVVANAEKKIIEDLTLEVKKAIYRTSYYNSNILTNDTTQYMDKKIDDILASCKEDIVERAANKLADRLSKTKKAREMLEIELKKMEETP